MSTLPEYKAADPVRHAALIRAVKKQADELGVEMPKVMILEGPRLPQYRSIIDVLRCPAVPSASTTGKHMRFSEGILKTLGSDARTHISKEMEAVIGHEFSHYQQFGTQIGLKALPIFALPIAAMVALHLIDKHAKKDGQPESLMGDIHHLDPEREAEEMLRNSSLSPHHNKHEWLSYLVTAAKYMAVAALATGVGFWVSSKVSNHFEYKADIAGGKAVKNFEAMASALEKVEARVNAMRPKIIEDLRPVFKEKTSTVAGKIFTTLESILLKAVDLFNSHPEIPERTSHIRRSAASAGASLF